MLISSEFFKTLLYGKYGKSVFFFYIAILGVSVTSFKSSQKWFKGKPNMWKTSSSSIKIAEVRSLFDIFSWPSLKPGSISAIKVKGKRHITTDSHIPIIPHNKTNEKKELDKDTMWQNNRFVFPFNVITVLPS
jgi:hypothetical protein